MKKLYKWSKNGQKMIIDTDFKEFNKQTNLITSGACISNTQYSNFIRAFEKENNGRTFDYDLQFFKIKSGLREYLKELQEKVVLYEFFIYNKKKEKDIIGWIIENPKNNTFKIIVNNRYRINYNKRYNVLEYCSKIINRK